MMRDTFNPDRVEPDMVDIVLQRILEMAPDFAAAVTLAKLQAILEVVDAEVRAEYGGMRTFTRKRGGHLTPEQRQAVFEDGLTDMPTTEIVAKHKISRATLYREMKRGGRFG